MTYSLPFGLNSGRRHRARTCAGLLLCAALVGWAAAVPEARSAADRPAADVAVRDVHGATVRPWSDQGQAATLLIFLMHDCPVANSFAPEINRLVEEHAQVRTFVVYVESDLTARAARAHAKDYNFKCGALLDPEHQLVKLTGVTVSPEAALYSATGELVYRGRIDDRVAEIGKRRVQPTRRDLRQALDALLAGKPVPEARTKAIGCYIPDSAPAKPKKSNAP